MSFWGGSDNSLKLERLYNGYKSRLFIVAKGILRDNALAEDAVHETYIRIMKYLHKIDENSVCRTVNFLIVVCRNVAIDIYKRNINTASIEEAEYDIDSGDLTTPLDIVITNENIRRIIDSIKLLNPIYRDVMLLKYGSDCSNREISELLHIEETTVRKRLERGRHELLKVLKRINFYE